MSIKIPPQVALDPKVLADAVINPRWNALTRTALDLPTIATWDHSLDRRQRILVPIDVQAFVVPKDGGEATVAVTGSSSDPAPFDEGAVMESGVHLHWAMPDALLRGQAKPDESSPQGGRLDLPNLPDRWVVLRLVMPVGDAAVHSSGWVIDARTASVAPLASFRGSFAASDRERAATLDGAVGGSPLWTASYAATRDRFAFHDPLADLPRDDKGPRPLAGEHAVYVVAGWWPELGEDPLAEISGKRRLESRLAELGWSVVHDGDDDVTREEDPRLERLRKNVGLDTPDTQPKLQTTQPSSKLKTILENGSIEMAVPVDRAAQVHLGSALPRYSTLVHGAVMGVPVNGRLPSGIDDRPKSAAVKAAIGADLDDVMAAFAAASFGLGPSQRLAAERLCAAFTGDMLDRIGGVDGLAQLEEREHADTFASIPGKPLPLARPDRLRTHDSAAFSPNNVGRKGRARHPRAAAKSGRAKGSDRPKSEAIARLSWMHDADLREAKAASKATIAPRLGEQVRETLPSQLREVTRPSPRFYYPQAPTLALRGAKPSHRHHGDGLFDERGLLRCRFPKECVPAWEGVVDGQRVLPSLGSGAIPDEVLRIAREAALLNPYAHEWLAASGASGGAASVQKRYSDRLSAEMVRMYGESGVYDGINRLASTGFRAAAPASPWANYDARTRMDEMKVAAQLARFSILRGTPPSPVSLTTWRQPWVPLWLEWKVVLRGETTLDRWKLDELEFETKTPLTSWTHERTLVGRSPIGQGLSKSLHSGISRWLQAEQARDLAGASTISDADEAALARLGDFLAPLDLVSASLDGIREQMLGLHYIGAMAHGAGNKPIADGLPTPLFGGILEVAALRLVDAFGRTLEIPSSNIATTSRLEVPAQPHAMHLRPRIQLPARWLWRLVDPALEADADPASAREAFVDQVNRDEAVNPIVGFLLPDHIDEALEVFSVQGEPLGQLGHDAISGCVTWECAPGRPLPPDAGPLAGLQAHDRILGEIAAQLVRVDVNTREAVVDPSRSPLNALLRAIDTTLWSMDTFDALGSNHVAGLVGRPVAVVRTTLRLDVPDDLDDVEITHEAGAEGRRAAIAALREQRFPVQLGTLHRADDSLLGFFVDDDFAHLHLVDKVVAQQARESGRHRGQLGLHGQNGLPPLDPLDHPYVIPDETVWLRIGQTVTLTLLMLPAGSVHLRSGILPLKTMSLADEWMSKGLAKLQPSLRVGPVLVDPAEVRLPLVHLLGKNQTFTRRDGPLTWRDDPIVAATQSALLPRLPHEAQEGWIRVTPDDVEEES
jgi:hypothetical protein